MGEEVRYQRDALPTTGLEVLMVGGRGSAVGTVVEDHELITQQLQCLTHDGHDAVDGLWTMSLGNEGIMFFKNRIGVYEQFPLVAEDEGLLFAGAVGRAQEAGPLCNGGLVHCGGCAAYAGGVVLDDNGAVKALDVNPSRQHVVQRFVVFACQRPHRQLGREKIGHGDKYF